MDRQMAPTSQGFDQGGIFSRDWFSDRLDRRSYYFDIYTVCSVEAVLAHALPVQGVAHLYGNQNRQGHRHGIRRLED